MESMFFGNLIKTFSKFSKLQLALLGVTGVVTLGGVGTGAYLLTEHFFGTEAVANIETETGETETQTEELLTAVNETEKETETETETETEVEWKQNRFLLIL